MANSFSKVYPVTYNSGSDNTDHERFAYNQIDAVDRFKDRSDTTLDDIYAGSLAVGLQTFVMEILSNDFVVPKEDSQWGTAVHYSE